jgi:hypothetical protein
MEESIPKLDTTPISASRIKTFESCSWLYYAKYTLKIPDSTNEGALKGSVIHDLFELLILPKHKNKYKSIIKKNHISGSASVDRLVKIYIKKYKLPSKQEIYDHINQMILVGLKADFYVKGAKLIKPEYEFNILNQTPRYLIRGFIDRPSKKGDEVIIDDYKTSKKKFEGEDIESNMQAIIYSIACKKIWPELTPKVRFVFLQFPEEPLLEISFTDEQLKGAEYYLESIQFKLDNFSKKQAYSNMAADKGMPSDGTFSGKLMCGFAKEAGQLKKDGSPMWHCSYKFPFKYYIVKKNGEIIKSYKKKEEIYLKDGESIEEAMYQGCPKFCNVISELPETKIEKKYTDALDDF